MSANSSSLEITKYHATGNDFLVYVSPTGSDALGAAEAAALCDRHRGVGADGIITLLPDGADADCTMILRNADGERAELSGNGIRCVARAAFDAGLADGDKLVVGTDAGYKSVRVARDAHGDVVAATVDMGAATFDPAEIPVAVASPFGLSATVHGVHYEGDAAGMGNPHYVVFVPDVRAARVAGHGPRLSNDERFPNATNVEFVSVRDSTSLDLRVWERGVGETLSCGTGACAAAAVAGHRGLVGSQVTVHVPGGELAVTVADTITLGGPVVELFTLTVDPHQLCEGGAGS